MRFAIKSLTLTKLFIDKNCPLDTFWSNNITTFNPRFEGYTYLFEIGISHCDDRLAERNGFGFWLLDFATAADIRKRAGASSSSARQKIENADNAPAHAPFLKIDVMLDLEGRKLLVSDNETTCRRFSSADRCTHGPNLCHWVDLNPCAPGTPCRQKAR